MTHGKKLLPVLSTLLVLVNSSSAYADLARDRQWHLATLGVPAAQKVSAGAGVTVGVIDTGVRANHPDLIGNVIPGIDLTGGSSNGMTDADGHGTAMAGLIAAHGHGNGGGALGIAPKAKIFPVRTKVGGIDDSGKLPTAIRMAVDRGVGVLSMSFTTGKFEALENAIKYASNADVVVVAGVGNRPGDIAIGYPARYPGVVAVGATGRDGKVSPVSVTGSELVLVAPGVDIVSTDGAGGYQIGTGTSDSTAIVAGAAALVRSRYPKLSAPEVVHRLTTTATDMGAPGRDPEYGYGALNLLAALTADVPPAGSVTQSPLPATQTPTLNSSNLPDVNAATPLRAGPVLAIAGFLFGFGILAGLMTYVWWLIRRRRSLGDAGARKN